MNTTDRAAAPTVIDPHAATQLGPNQFLTPEGFLVCADVPIARIGVMHYHVSDGLPLTTDNPDGIIRVTRGPEDLFHPHAIASFIGKPTTDDHPDEDVTPANWRLLAGGHAFNLRQGEGDDADVLLADLMITDAALIRDIQAGKREVSCGYDAAYVQTAPGEGRQTNIIGNHIALVERGRCGPRCAIGDSLSTPKETAMPAAVKKPLADRLKKFRDEATALLEDPSMMDDATAPEGGSGNEIHVHLHSGAAPVATTAAATDDVPPGEGGEGGAAAAATGGDNARIDAIEKSVADIATALGTLTEAVGKLSAAPAAPTEDADGPVDPDEENPAEKAKTKDSAALETVFKAVCAQAEVLVPGITFPTFDATVKRHATVDSLCKLRRRALDMVAATNDGQALLKAVSGGKAVDLAALDCANTASLFKSAATTRGLMNNRANTNDGRTVVASNPNKAPTTLAELNAMNKKLFAPKASA